MIVCLLNKYELRTIGVDESLYRTLCAKASIQFISMPIMEGGVPEDVKAIDGLLEAMTGKKALCHCRGGVGRAGMIAACYLLKWKLKTSAEKAVAEVREKRDPRSVETAR